MIISDLSYLESVSKAPSIEGGLVGSLLGGSWGNVQINVIDVRQLATSSALALAYGGNANAYADALNEANNGQFIA